MELKILYRDDAIVVIEKPSGMHVHPPDNSPFRIKRWENTMGVLRDQLNRWVYPVHRLDVSTSGVVVFALNSKTASLICGQFAQATVKKVYEAVVRGWTELEGEIDTPLKREGSQTLAESLTQYETLQKIELPIPSQHHDTSRYSLLRCYPKTGRYHQIRRHLQRISHPILGDASHGDPKKSRSFADYTGIKGLLLRAKSIELTHPHTKEKLKIESPENEFWRKIYTLFENPDSIQPPHAVTVPLESPAHQISAG